jgi:hypothetical protein
MLRPERELPGPSRLKAAGRAHPTEHFIVRRRDRSGPPWRAMAVYMPHTTLWNMFRPERGLPGPSRLKIAGRAYPTEHFILRRRDRSGPPWRAMAVYMHHTTLWNMFRPERELPGPSRLKAAGRAHPTEHFILRRRDHSGPPWRAMAVYMPHT